MNRTPETVFDELLVLRSQDGDESALGTLIRRWHLRFARHAHRVTGDKDVANDIAQESWMSIIRGLKRLQDPAKFRSWAFRIVTRRAVDWIRAQDRQRELDEEAPPVETPASIHDDDIVDLRRALTLMPAKSRTILNLSYVEELSHEEISEVLNIPVGTVKSRLHHARERLRETMERMAK